MHKEIFRSFVLLLGRSFSSTRLRAAAGSDAPCYYYKKIDTLAFQEYTLYRFSLIIFCEQGLF